MTPHERAVMTMDALQRRKAIKKRKKEELSYAYKIEKMCVYSNKRATRKKRIGQY